MVGSEHTAIKGERREEVDGDAFSSVGGAYTQHITGPATFVFESLSEVLGRVGLRAPRVPDARPSSGGFAAAVACA